MLLRVPILLSVVLLAGCQQTLPLIPGLSADSKMSQKCHIDNNQLLDWLKYEHRFISSTLGDKQQLLIDAEARQPDTLYPLLLSTPGQSSRQVARAQEMLSQLPLSAAESACHADRYLQLRMRQLQQQLNTLQQLQDLELGNQELKRQVDALTDLEQQITRQRKEH